MTSRKPRWDNMKDPVLPDSTSTFRCAGNKLLVTTAALKLKLFYPLKVLELRDNADEHHIQLENHTRRAFPEICAELCLEATHRHTQPRRHLVASRCAAPAPLQNAASAAAASSFTVAPAAWSRSFRSPCQTSSSSAERTVLRTDVVGSFQDIWLW